MDYLVDTIAAISTPYGRGGIGVIRISGSEAIEVVDRVFFAYNMKPLRKDKGYSIRLGTIIVNDEQIDEVIVLLFRGPKSYTGEDVVEIQCHGGPVVLEQILRGLLDSGARVAEQGEFTRRAVVNGRISLSEAEGIGEIITAISKQSEQAAFMLSKGSLYRETERLKSSILALQGTITAYIDFPEEDAVEINEEELKETLLSLEEALDKLLTGYDRGLKIVAGVRTAIVGAPNVGKSTIMNLLAGYEKSIVTPMAGTTRDVLEHQIDIGGITLLLSDTAGIHKTTSIVEKIGVERAYETLDQSSVILVVFDNSKKLTEEEKELIKTLNGRQTIAVVNKTDLNRKLEVIEVEKSFDNVIYISAKDRSSLEDICNEIKKVVGVYEFSPNHPMIINERQRIAVSNTHKAIKEALASLIYGMTLDAVYIALDDALFSLMELSGENVSEAILDEVFSKFCVGK